MNSKNAIINAAAIPPKSTTKTPPTLPKLNSFTEDPFLAIKTKEKQN